VVAYDFLLVFAGLRGTVVDLQAAEVSSQSQKEQQQQEKERRGGYSYIRFRYATPLKLTRTTASGLRPTTIDGHFGLLQRLLTDNHRR